METFIAAPFFFENCLRQKERRTMRRADFEQLCALTRINILAALGEAEHGWLGASFSCVEILAALYSRHIADPSVSLTERDSVILSKGHAVLTQYAILSGMGIFPIEKLRDYKAIRGLPAHCDRTIPGIDSDSGSLGQGLSKGIGITLMHRANKVPHRCFVLIGDGELQEGQVFEALLTLKRQNLSNCIPIIDCNALQSDSRTADIKDAGDWPALLRGIGLQVLCFDGHRTESVFSALEATRNFSSPTVLIAQTIKGAGSKLTAMSRKTARRNGVWHGKIPNRKEYFEILEELVQLAGLPPLSIAFEEFKAREPAKSGVQTKPAPARDSSAVVENLSTGEGFTKALEILATRIPRFFVLNADLEKSCRLSGFASRFPERFIEVGISEQDMASIANGIGLAKGIGVVNTYASFYKRCFDQVFACAAEGVPAIFVGHYAGLDYFTDGKSHQSLNDIAIMRSIPGLEVYEPLTPGEAAQLAETLITRMISEFDACGRSCPAYVRLHRTPAHAPDVLPEPMGIFGPRMFVGSVGRTLQARLRPLICTASPQGLEIALEARDRLSGEGIETNVAAFSTYCAPSLQFQAFFSKASVVITLESHLTTGGLADLLAVSSSRGILRMGAEGLTGSARNISEAFSRHGLTSEMLCHNLLQELQRQESKSKKSQSTQAPLRLKDQTP
ncbi:MAG: 1-deoxy-D-xylulose-5-phosphate synthase N-terminal domain-containing protein [Candidatus Ozemobacteraceae bacterium]